MRHLWLLLLLLAACSRGPDQAALKSQVQAQIDNSFKPGLLELAALKRQGSSPLPAAESGKERVVIYYNATLRLKEGYDFKDWGLNFGYRVLDYDIDDGAKSVDVALEGWVLGFEYRF